MRDIRGYKGERTTFAVNVVSNGRTKVAARGESGSVPSYGVIVTIATAVSDVIVEG